MEKRQPLKVIEWVAIAVVTTILVAVTLPRCLRSSPANPVGMPASNGPH